MTQCVRYFVSGHVQGVFFRSSVRSEALSLNLTGWARNLSDGRVEVLACGEQEQLDALSKWLWIGPPQAQVSGVLAVPAPTETGEGFKILY